MYICTLHWKNVQNQLHFLMYNFILNIKKFQMRSWNKKYGNSLKAKTKVMCYALCVKTYSILVECQRPQHTNVTQLSKASLSKRTL